MQLKGPAKIKQFPYRPFETGWLLGRDFQFLDKKS